jgi:hypothetical protein
MSPPSEGEQQASGRLVNAAASDLCRDCGLCCDGSMFAAVHLQDSEVEAATLNGLEPFFDEGSVRFPQTAVASTRSARFTRTDPFAVANIAAYC